MEAILLDVIGRRKRVRRNMKGMASCSMHTDSKPQQSIYVLLVMAMLALRLFFWLSPSHESRMLAAYLWPGVVAAIAILVWRRFGSMPRSAGVSLCLAAWFVVCCVLGGDHYLEYNLHFLLGTAITFGLCYPLFVLMDGKARIGWLTIVAICYTCMMTALAAVGVFAAIAGVPIKSPFSDLTVGIQINNRLWAFGMHPNEVGSALSIGLFMALMLCFQGRNAVSKLLAAAAALVICTAIAFTASRTSIVTSAAGLGAAAFWWLWTKLPLRHQVWRGLISLAAMALVLILSCAILLGNLFALPQRLQGFKTGSVAVMDGAVAEGTEAQPAGGQSVPDAERIVTDRSITQDLSTFAFRTEIWQAGLQYIKDRPITLLIGSSDGEVARIPNRYLGHDVYHLHNSWLEMLALTGVPGVLMYLYLMVTVLVSSVRLFVDRTVRTEHKFLAVVPILLLLNGLMEIYPCVSGNVMDMMFLVICGAVVGLAGQYRETAPNPAAANAVRAASSQIAA